MKVFLSELAESKLLKLSEYLLENWNLKTRDKFISKLSEKIKQISLQPNSCPTTSGFENLYKCVVPIVSDSTVNNKKKSCLLL